MAAEMLKSENSPKAKLCLKLYSKIIKSLGLKTNPIEERLKAIVDLAKIIKESNGIE